MFSALRRVVSLNLPRRLVNNRNEYEKNITDLKKERQKKKKKRRKMGISSLPGLFDRQFL